MEYQGAGSFWTQLAATQGGFTMFAPRKIDELLRNPESSLVEILSDDEVISEFRSANPKLVSRLTDSEGLAFITNLIINRDLPQSLTDAERLKLPFIASELVACEVDQLMDAFVREVPGHRSPLDRLFDFIIEGNTDPTVIGYVVRVLSILTTRRGPIIDKYISESEEEIHQGLVEMCQDRSICDLVIKLMTEDEIRRFPSQFSLFEIIRKLRSSSAAENAIYILDSSLNRPGIMHERILQIFHKLEHQGRQEGYVAELIDYAINDRDITAINILSDLIFFCFKYSTRAAELVGGEASPATTTEFSSMPTPDVKPVLIDDSEDVRIGDDSDEDTPPQVSTVTAKFTPTPFTDFGYFLINSLSESINANTDGLIAEYAESPHRIQLLVSFLRLLSRLVTCANEDQLNAKFFAQISTQSIFNFPKSSAVHNLCQSCLISDTWTSLTSLENILSVFEKEAVKFLEISEKNSGGCYGHVCRISDRLVLVMGEDAIKKQLPDDGDILIAAAKRWNRVINCRLADAGTTTTGPAVNSPRSATPIVDFGIAGDFLDPPCWNGQLVSPIDSDNGGLTSARMVRSTGSISDDEDAENTTWAN